MSETEKVETDTYSVRCPTCNAKVGAPCTQPTSKSRTPVAWFHMARVESFKASQPPERIKCEAQGCNNRAQNGLVMKRPEAGKPNRSDVRQTIYFDVEYAPKRAAKMCTKHTHLVIGDVIQMLGYVDEPMS